VPAPNTSLRYTDQPVTLSIANAVATQGPSTYTFEVATDSNFANRVQTKDVSEGSNGQTSVKLDQLSGGADYYWHVRATAAGTQGVFGATYKFTVGPPIVLGPPTLLGPISNAQTGSMPIFSFSNGSRSGPVGPISYRIEVSTNPSFSPDVFDSVVPETAGGRTDVQSPNELPAATNLFWRVTTADASNGVSSPVSSTGTFNTALTIDLSKVVYLNSPNVSGWKRTGYLVSVEQDGSEAAGGPMCMTFTDPGWPDSPWVYGTDPNFGVFGNQWYFANIGGTWYGGAGEWLYRGAPSVCKAGQGTTTIGPDSGFGAPFSSWQPRVGELVGYMVTSVARAGSIARTVDERTQIVVQPWRDTSRGSPAVMSSQVSIYGMPSPSLR
jgi:hypothetical protein